MLTLLINAPAIPWLLKITGLDKISDLRQELREKARESHMTYTRQLIQQFKDKGDETMRGVDWKLVESFAGLGSVNENEDGRRHNHGGRVVKRGKIRAILKKTRWNLLDKLRKPLLLDNLDDAPFDEEMGTSAEERVRAMDRTLAKVGDHESELPFTGSLKHREMSVDPSGDQCRQGTTSHDEIFTKVTHINNPLIQFRLYLAYSARPAVIDF